MGMSMNSTTSCAKLLTEDGTKLYLKCFWSPSQCRFLLLTGNSSWKCELNSEDIFERALDWGFQSPYEYIRDVLQDNLTQHNENTIYRCSDAQSGSKKLSWELKRGSLTLIASFIFNPPLSEIESQNNLELFLDFLLEDRKKLEEVASSQSVQLGQLKEEAEKCLRQSETIKDDAQKKEMELYEKFVALLNAKKAKLREMRAEIQRLKARKSDESKSIITGEDDGSASGSESP